MKAASLAAVTLLAGLVTGEGHAQATATPTVARTMSDVLKATTAADWRRLEPENTLYLQLPSGRVVIELAPAFAPMHAANLRTLVRQKYFDGLAIIRSQDNFVVQWGDADGKRSLGDAQSRVPPEFTVRVSPALPFEALPDRDGYAAEVGFSQGFPAARDPVRGEAWLPTLGTKALGRSI